MVCPHCQNPIPDGSSFCNHCGMAPAGTPKKSRSPLFYVLVTLAVVILGLYVFMRQTVGSKQADRVIAAVVHTPVILEDETQNVRAASWRAIPLNAPYNGTLDVNVNVARGNPLDVILVDASQLPTLQSNNWSNVLVNPNFSAAKMTTYRRTSPIDRGSYYLVLRDTSLGIFSQSATDVAIKATLNP